jgi:dTMP kinase
VNRGRLVAVEGIDGCGKSTQTGRIAAALRARGRDVVQTREPSDGPAGRRIRALAGAGSELSAEEELAAFLEDRREHVERVIEPALAAGRDVVTDRYFLSTVAYQGARGLDPRALLEDCERRFPLPDLALLLEVDAATGLERVRGRGGTPARSFERRERLERAAEIFASIERPYLERIDARRAPDAVAADVLSCLERRLALPARAG